MQLAPRGWFLALTMKLSIALVGCVAVPAFCPDALYETSMADPEVRLPEDELPHCSPGTEWWYYSGRLETASRRSFGVEAVIFHRASGLLSGFADLWIAHYSILEVSTGTFTYSQAPLIAPPPWPRDGLNLKVPLIQMSGGDGADRLHCRMSDGGFELDLVLADTREPVLHGGRGYVPYGADGRSFYYSRPKMRAQGTLVVEGDVLEVSGQLWFDRQWGRDLTDPHQTWNWFSLRLDDGTDVMLYNFPASDAPVAIGTIVPDAGDPVTVSADEFSIESTAVWTSPHTGITYDVAWRVRIPSSGLDLTVVAVANDQELDARTTTLNIYWEGLCQVTGLRGTEVVTGDAYVEQANAGTLSRR